MSIYDTLNEAQKAAVMHTEGPLLCLAGAGSGKTRALTHRIAYLIDEMGVNPWNILAITFTNKAAQEMRERVDQIAGFGGSQVWVATFHATCMRILRRYIDKLGFDTNFTIYDTDDQKSVMKGVCKRLNIDTKMYKERTLLSAISSAKDELIGVREYELSVMGDYRKAVIARAYREYQETLQRSNALDFDDIIVKTVELFKACPEVLHSYQERFRYIMVDEYQDTNTAQFELVRLLADGYRNICVVGDDDQSIYKFRGANIRNILDFEKVYPEAKVVKLEQNYRSSQNILDAANAVIANNVGRKDKVLWTVKESGSKVHFRQFDTGYEEAEYIADDVIRKVKREGAEYKDFAVLYRTNAQARLLEERMVVEGIPYKVVGGINFYSRMEIKDILAYLKTIDNGRDDVALNRIVNVPKRSIGTTTMEKVAEYAAIRDISLYEAMTQSDEIDGLGRAEQKIRGFVNLIQVFKSGLDIYPISDLIQAVIEKSGYVEYIKAESDDDQQAEDRLANIDELITKAVVYQEINEYPTLSGFLEEIALVADIDSVEDGDNRMLLMTLHSAKGLEFPNVYLAGMEDGLFPSYMTIVADDVAEIEEERRLAYVGITRAMEDLTITCARSRMIRGETQYNPVSRFVREIPDNLLDNAPPAAKRRSFESFDDFERELGRGGSFGGSQSGNSGFGGYGSQTSGRSGGFGNNAGFGGSGYGGGNAGYGSGTDYRNAGAQASASAYDFRPKATLKPKVTAKADKPFIAKEMGSLNNLAGLQKGMVHQAPADLEYGVGDRVRHIKYGEGTVLVIDREPRDYKVTISFDKAGQKIMYASFAKLKRV